MSWIRTLPQMSEFDGSYDIESCLNVQDPPNSSGTELLHYSLKARKGHATLKHDPEGGGLGLSVSHDNNIHVGQVNVTVKGFTEAKWNSARSTKTIRKTNEAIAKVQTC